MLDPVSGEEVTKTLKVIQVDEAGAPIYQHIPLGGLGIKLANLEIKGLVYAKKAQEQIATQQEALTVVSTARAQAQQAEHDALTRGAKGKAQVVQAKYEEEVTQLLVACQMGLDLGIPKGTR